MVKSEIGVILMTVAESHLRDTFIAFCATAPMQLFNRSQLSHELVS